MFRECRSSRVGVIERKVKIEKEKIGLCLFCDSYWCFCLLFIFFLVLGVFMFVLRGIYFFNFSFCVFGGVDISF